MATRKTKGAKGGGTIRQRPDGRWEARYTLGIDPGTGKQIQKSVYGKTQKEVRQKLTAITAEIDGERNFIFAAFQEIQKLSGLLVGQRMDLFFDDFRQNTRGRRIVADVVEKNGLLERFVQHTVNILDGFSTQGELSVVFLRERVIKALNRVSL